MTKLRLTNTNGYYYRMGKTLNGNVFYEGTASICLSDGKKKWNQSLPIYAKENGLDGIIERIEILRKKIKTIELPEAVTLESVKAFAEVFRKMVIDFNDEIMATI